MPSTYSKNYNIELIATGERSGTWGAATNVNLGRLEAISSGIFTHDISGSTHGASGTAYSLQSTESSSPDASDGTIPEASGGRAKVLIFNDSGATWDNDKFVKVAETLTDRFYLVVNRSTRTSGGTQDRGSSIFDLQFQGGNDTGAAGVTIPFEKSAFVSVVNGVATDAMDGLIGLKGNVTLADGTSFIISNGVTDVADFKVSRITDSGLENSLTAVSSSSNITITDNGHGMVAGDQVIISGQITDPDRGFSDTEINNNGNPYIIIAPVDTNTFTITSSGTADSSGTFGDATLRFEYSAFYLQFDTSAKTVNINKPIDLSSVPTSITVKDEEAAALDIKESSNSYIKLNTVGGSDAETPSINFGESIIVPTAKVISLPKEADSITDSLDIGGGSKDKLNVFAHATRHLLDGADPISLVGRIQTSYLGGVEFNNADHDTVIGFVTFDLTGRSGPSTIIMWASGQAVLPLNIDSGVETHWEYSNNAGTTSGVTINFGTAVDNGTFQTPQTTLHTTGAAFFLPTMTVAVKVDVPAASNQHFLLSFSSLRTQSSLSFMTSVSLIAIDLGVTPT